MQPHRVIPALDEAKAGHPHLSLGGKLTPVDLFQKLIADNGVACSMSRFGNVCDNAAMESFFSSLKTECTARKVYRTRNPARAELFDDIELFHNSQRRHVTIGYISPMKSKRITAASEKWYSPNRQQLRSRCVRTDEFMTHAVVWSRDSDFSVIPPSVITL